MLAIIGGSLFTGAKLIKKGTLLVDEGKIIAVGSVDIPNNARIIEIPGKIITPGLIDAHSHLGATQEGVNWQEADINEATDPVTSQVRIIDAVNPKDPGFKDAVQGGVTCVQVLPGSANVVCGVGAIVKTHGRVVEEMLLEKSSGLKIAFGENPKREHGRNKRLPSTRMGSAALLRQTLAKAHDYQNKDDKKRDLQLEPIVDVLKRKMPLRAHAHRSDDIVTALRIAIEFDLDITIEHCTEGHEIPDILRQAKVSCAVGPTLSSRSKLELANMSWQTVVTLDAAGVPICLITDHPVVPIGYLSICGALAVREGLSWEKALAAITINPARHLGIDNRVGSLEPGKDADFIIWDGSDPFHYRTKVERTFINGIEVFARE